MKHSFSVVVVLVLTTTGCVCSVPSPTNDADADDVVVVVVAMETLLHVGFLENTFRRENRNAFAGVLWTPDGTLSPLLFMTMITML